MVVAYYLLCSITVVGEKLFEQNTVKTAVSEVGGDAV
jgi:hypothetical protein